jgi:hypothetical protein
MSDNMGVDQAQLAAAAQASAGLGVTSVDVDALAAQIAAMQARLNDLESEKAAAGGEPLAGTAATIAHFLAIHGDPVASGLGQDLAAAVAEAAQSGDTSRVAQIAARLDRYLARNAPYPGENYAYRNASAFVSDLPDLIDAYRPPAAGSALVPANVVAGTVVG